MKAFHRRDWARQDEADIIGTDVKRVAEFFGRCGRGFWLAFLALALLTVSVPTTTDLTLDRSPTVTSKRGDSLAIPRQDLPLKLSSDYGSKAGWSRATERNGPAQPSGDHGIAPDAVRIAAARRYPGASHIVHVAFHAHRFRPFDAQAPPV